MGVTTAAFQGTTNVAFNGKIKSINATLEVGICYSHENNIPTYNDFKKVLGSTMQDYSFTIMNVLSGTTYYYRTYVKLLDEIYYSEVNSVTTQGESDIIINGHRFIDLGLPSGLLWAETNVGASSATENGGYYAWGETELKSYFSWDTYKWGDGEARSKYNLIDKKLSIESQDDVATIKWGAPCRMPSSQDFEELLGECDWTDTSNYYGVSGFIVTGPSGNAIFIPKSGYYYDDVLDNYGLWCYYWSRSLQPNGTDKAYCFFYEGPRYPLYSISRYYGLPIRPVAEK